MYHVRFPRFATAAALTALLAMAAQAALNIVPKPTTMTPGAGTLVFGASDVVAIYRDAGSDSTLPWVEKLFSQAKIPTSRVTTAGAAKVSITKGGDATALGAEGYQLNVTATQVAIIAPTLTGQFYAVQTLRQMFPATIEDSTSGVTGPITLDQVQITDKPRFEYRGIMVDPVRHFLPLPYIYQHIDRMALYKLNRMHFLLGNDQGWRIESKAFPLLHEKSSRNQVGGGTPPAGQRWYYTQDEMRAVVQYASLRRIKIVPEIDMPGHCMAICFAYPNIGTPNTAIQTSEDVGLSIMNVTSNDKSTRPAIFQGVHTFVGQLWRDMATVFTSDQYQIGGDECFNIDKPAFVAFALAVQDTLTKLGKKTIAWDEVKAAGGLATGNWSQDWHQNNNIGNVMSTCNFFYLDHHNEPGDGANVLTWCGQQVSLQNMYSANLSFPALFGVEATLFSERLTVYPDYWDRQIWPRLTATAEIGWFSSNTDYNGYVTRLAPHGSRLSSMGIKYFKTTGVSWGAGTVNTMMTNLYDGFVPVITPDVGIIARQGRPGKLDGKGQKTYNALGRQMRFSPSGHPESLRITKKP